MSKVILKKKWRKYQKKLDSEGVELLNTVSMDGEKALAQSTEGESKVAAFASLDEPGSDKLGSYSPGQIDGQDDFLAVVSKSPAAWPQMKLSGPCLAGFREVLSCFEV